MNVVEEIYELEITNDNIATQETEEQIAKRLEVLENIGFDWENIAIR